MAASGELCSQMQRLRRPAAEKTAARHGIKSPVALKGRMKLCRQSLGLAAEERTVRHEPLSRLLFDHLDECGISQLLCIERKHICTEVIVPV